MSNQEDSKHLLAIADRAKEAALCYVKGQLMQMSDEMPSEEDMRPCLAIIEQALESFMRVNMCGHMMRTGRMPIAWEYQPEDGNNVERWK